MTAPSAPSANIKVCVRMRPLDIHDPSQPDPNPRTGITSIECWNLKNNVIAPNPDFDNYEYQNQTSDKAKRTAYGFDHLFFPVSKTVEIYNGAVKGIVAAALEGYHGSVFAYGQTATGKTFTMQGTADEPGIVPLAVHDCFNYIRQRNGVSRDREFLLRMSYMEIYNEQINDLLSPSSLQTIRIYEQRGKGVVVKGMKEEVVISAEQVFALVAAGEAHRHIGSTEMNANSSRSHTIFRLVIESKALNSGAKSKVRVSTLSLVDLAGSESVKSTHTSGDRQNEGKFINKSLLTLGKVIWKLSEGSRRNLSIADLAAHIPYRDSKLTRLLQPSLGGNAQISMICNVSPEASHVEETHNTLKFASRAKRIKQRASVTEVMDDATLLQQYREEINALKNQLTVLAQENQSIQTQLLSPGVVGSGGLGGGEDEEETEAIAAAIHNLERLILRNAEEKRTGRSGGGGTTRKGSFFGTRSPKAGGGGKHLFFERVTVGSKDPAAGALDAGASIRVTDIGSVHPVPSNDGSSSVPGEETLKPPLHALRTGSKESSDIQSELALLSCRMNGASMVSGVSVRSGTPESFSSSYLDNHSLVNELQRVQGLLGQVLEKKNNKRMSMGVDVTTSKFPSTVGVGTPNPAYNNSAPPPPPPPTLLRPSGQFSSKEEEISSLRSSVRKLEVDRKLAKADATFLEQQVQDKDDMLNEVAGLLEAVERHQEMLERENAELAEALSKTQGRLGVAEMEIIRIWGEGGGEEEEHEMY